MDTRLARFFFIFAVAGGMVLGGCNRGGPTGDLVEVTERVERGVTPGQRLIAFDSFDGDITLQDTTGGEATFVFTKRARAETREEARNRLQDLRIEERGAEGEFAYETSTSAPEGLTSVDVEGRIPAGTHLRLRLRNGDVALSGLRGPLDVNDENGDIRIGGAARDTRAETRNGSVEVGMRQVPSGGEVRLRTSNGDVELTLPASSSANVRARTEAGEIDLGGLSFSSSSLNRSGAGGRFEGELGSGNAEVRMRTENGDVTLREGTVRRLPDVGRDTTQRDTTQRDTTSRDTTGLDSLFGPPAAPGGAQRDTAGRSRTRLGPPPGGQQQRQRRPSQQQQAPYTDDPPLLLRRPAQQQGGSGAATPSDTSATPRSSMPGLPSPAGRDTTGVL